MRHAIIELPSIPRDRKVLQSLINGARQAQRVRNRMRFASYNFIGWGCIVLAMHGCSGATPATASSHQLYLPVIQQEVRS